MESPAQMSGLFVSKQRNILYSYIVFIMGSLYNKKNCIRKINNEYK